MRLLEPIRPHSLGLFVEGDVMKTQPVIMVQIADRAWAQAALPRACELALSLQAPIALVQMVPVQHPLLLGDQLGYLAVAPADLRLLNDLEVALANIGVEYSLHLFQYVTLAGGIADAADLVAASIVFATLPTTLPMSLIPWWHSLQLEVLRRRLAQRGRWLISEPAREFTTAPVALAQLHAQPG